MFKFFLIHYCWFSAVWVLFWINYHFDITSVPDYFFWVGFLFGLPAAFLAIRTGIKEKSVSDRILASVVFAMVILLTPLVICNHFGWINGKSINFDSVDLAWGLSSFMLVGISLGPRFKMPKDKPS